MSILERVVNDIKAIPGVVGSDRTPPTGPVTNAPVPPPVRGSITDIPYNGPQAIGGPDMPVRQPLAMRPLASLLPEAVVRQLGTAASGTPGVHMPSYVAGLHDGAHAYAGVLSGPNTVNQAPGFETYDPSGGPQQIQLAPNNNIQGSTPSLQNNEPLYGQPLVQ